MKYTSRIELGVILFLDENPAKTIWKISELGFRKCQIACWNPIQDNLMAEIRNAKEFLERLC